MKPLRSEMHRADRTDLNGTNFITEKKLDLLHLPGEIADFSRIVCAR